MDWQLWCTYLIAVFFICGSPGPNMLLVMTVSIRHGFRASFATMAGCGSAVLIYLAASAAGLGALLKAFPMLFETLRWLGAIYLIYLGIRAWRSPLSPGIARESAAPNAIAPSTLFHRAFLVGMGNPKLALFAAAFFPQFLDPAAAAMPQFALLLVTFMVVETGWYMTYALGGSSLSRFLQKQTMQRLFNRMTGMLFAGFGLMLLSYKP